MSVLVYITIILSIYAFVSTAWVADDAYITFRSIDNFWHGDGLRWNIQERVQTYTHPLWMIILSIFAYPSKDLYATALIISGIAYLCIIYALYQNLCTKKFILCILTLLASQAFVSFSSSGLENPLLHVISCLSIVYFSKQKSIDLQPICLVIALLFITRMDSILIFIPLLFFILFKNIKQKGITPNIKPFLIGFTPAIVWSLFSLVYYGSIFPNTAFSKLNHGISHTALATQSVIYFKENFLKDPITLTVIILFLSISLYHRNLVSRLISAGILLNIMYLFWMGADYMYGRFLSNIFICATTCLYINHKINYSHIIAGILFIFVLYNSQDWSVDFSNPYISPDGLADERGFYYTTNGLMPRLLNKNQSIYERYRWMKDLKSPKPSNMVIQSNIGMYGYYAPRNLHIVDPLTLSDLFLAQHPMRSGRWRIGHHERHIPYEYLTSIQTGQNRMTDPDDRAVLVDTWLICRAPLFTVDRWAAIVRLNTGQIKQRAVSATTRYTVDNSTALFFPQRTEHIWIGVDRAYLNSLARPKRAQQFPD